MSGRTDGAYPLPPKPSGLSRLPGVLRHDESQPIGLHPRACAGTCHGFATQRRDDPRWFWERRFNSRHAIGTEFIGRIPLGISSGRILGLTGSTNRVLHP